MNSQKAPNIDSVLWVTVYFGGLVVWESWETCHRSHCSNVWTSFMNGKRLKNISSSPADHSLALSHPFKRWHSDKHWYLNFSNQMDFTVLWGEWLNPSRCRKRETKAWKAMVTSWYRCWGMYICIHHFQPRSDDLPITRFYLSDAWLTSGWNMGLSCSKLWYTCFSINNLVVKGTDVFYVSKWFCAMLKGCKVDPKCSHPALPYFSI